MQGQALPALFCSIQPLQVRPYGINGMKLDILDLGLIEYERAWKLQDEYAAEIAEGSRPPTLLLLEHPHTFTFGRKGNAKNLLWSPAELTRRGVSVHWVDRGGDVTYHGPGQLVGYPLIPLGPLRPDGFSSGSSGLEDSVDETVHISIRGLCWLCPQIGADTYRRACRLWGASHPTTWVDGRLGTGGDLVALSSLPS